MAESLQVTYSTLEAAAARADGTAESFMSELNQLESHVKSMVWMGQSGTAFQGYFDNLKRQLQPVQDTLRGLSAQIRGAAQQMRESDQAVSQAFRG